MCLSDDIPKELLGTCAVQTERTHLTTRGVDETLVLMVKIPANLDIANAICRSTIGLKVSSIFLALAIKNTAVQPILDGVGNYLPNPAEREI